MYLFLNCELGPSENIQTHVTFGCLPFTRSLTTLHMNGRCFVMLQIIWNNDVRFTTVVFVSRLCPDCNSEQGNFVLAPVCRLHFSLVLTAEIFSKINLHHCLFLGQMFYLLFENSCLLLLYKHVLRMMAAELLDLPVNHQQYSMLPSIRTVPVSGHLKQKLSFWGALFSSR